MSLELKVVVIITSIFYIHQMPTGGYGSNPQLTGRRKTSANRVESLQSGGSTRKHNFKYLGKIFFLQEKFNINLQSLRMYFLMSMVSFDEKAEINVLNYENSFNHVCKEFNYISTLSTYIVDMNVFLLS